MSKEPKIYFQQDFCLEKRWSLGHINFLIFQWTKMKEKVIVPTLTGLAVLDYKNGWRCNGRKVKKLTVVYV